MRSIGAHHSFHLGPPYHPTAGALLERCRYHLLRNVVPTLAIFVAIGGLALLLGEQIDRAREEREMNRKAGFQQLRDKGADAPATGWDTETGRG